MFLAVGRFYDAKVVHFSVAVEVEVGDVVVFLVELLLKFFQVSTLTEERCNGLEIEVLRDILVRGTNRNCLVCAGRHSKGHYHDHEEP